MRALARKHAVLNNRAVHVVARGSRRVLFVAHLSSALLLASAT